MMSVRKCSSEQFGFCITQPLKVVYTVQVCDACLPDRQATKAQPISTAWLKKNPASKDRIKLLE